MVALAGEVRAPGAFEYCLYQGEPIPTQLGLGDVSYATCADGVTAGTRSVTIEQKYTTVLTALGYPTSAGNIGQGAHYNGVIDVSGYVGVSLWVDPLP